MSQACPSDNDIVGFAQGLVDPRRRDTIAAHLDTCEACMALVAEAVRAGSLQPDPVPPPAPVLPQRGDELGRYLVLDRLGSGGLGDVFAAYDPELDRRVALKLLRVGDAEAAARLKREAQALAKLAHPNVVHVYDVATAQQRIFIAMELVAGHTLREYVREDGRDWRAIRDVFVAAGRGLAAAHEAGIIHRDFKPQNVLIGADGRPRVADFGLARVAMAEAAATTLGAQTEATALAQAGTDTASGAILGTPAYMAPEQHVCGPIDERADQFAFSVALFEAMFGQRPFKARDLAGLKHAKETGAIVDPPPGLRPPAWLRRAVQQGLAPRPDARFESMHELLAALERDRKTRVRWWTGWAVAAVLATALGVGLASRPAELDPEVAARIEALEAEARAAGKARRFVYPDPEHPGAATAYAAVVGLEALEDPSGTGRARGQALRAEFGAALRDLGAQLWDVDGGRPFALDLYASALVFEPDHEGAARRAALGLGQLNALGNRAGEGSFTESDLVVAATLAALTDPDPTARIERARAAIRDPNLPLSAAVQLQRLVGDGPEPEASPAVAPPPVAVPPPPQVATAMGGPPPRRAEAPGKLTEARIDRKSAARLAKEAASAKRRGDRDKAKQLYHQALGAHQNNIAALEGLSDILFDDGEYFYAKKYAKKAAALSPRAARLRMKLGDVYFNLQQYKDARTQYQKAQQLGHLQAAKRLQKVKEKTGA